jgi:hypothetical protein
VEEARQRCTDGYDGEEHFMHNYSWVLFFRRSLLLIELSGRVNGGCLLMMALLSAFIPCGRTCSPFMRYILLLTLCTGIYCIIRTAEITFGSPLSKGLSMESAIRRLWHFFQNKMKVIWIISEVN